MFLTIHCVLVGQSGAENCLQPLNTSLFNYAASVAEEFLYRPPEDLQQSCNELAKHVFRFDIAMTPSTLCFDVYKYLVNKFFE